MHESSQTVPETAWNVPGGTDSNSSASAPAVEAPKQTAAVPTAPPLIRITSENLGWRVFKNTAGQVAGRNFIMLGRLAVASIIVRGCGRGVFGAYSLIFAILTIAEWVLDFGTTDTFVREVCHQPERSPRLLRVLTAAKFFQVPVAFTLLVAILLALRYPPDIVKAGIVGGVGLVFFSGVLICRVMFKAELALEREIAAELASVTIMIPMVLWVSRHGGSLFALFVCHAISRAVFLGACLLFGGSRFKPSLEGISWADVRWGLRSSAPIGAIGLLVVIYETADLLLLSRLGSFNDLAYYSGAQKFIGPMMVALASVGATLYPVAASHWPSSRRQFEEACQRGLDTVFLLAGVGICSLLAGPAFFIGLLGRTLVGGAPVLRVLALLCFVKAISSAVGPVLYVIHAQGRALQFIVLAVVAKLATIAVLAPRFGYMGVAYGAVAVELFFAGCPLVYLIWRFSDYRLRWTVAIKVILITFAASTAARLLWPASPLLAAIVAPVMYLPLVFWSGAAHLSDIRWLLKWKTA